MPASLPDLDDSKPHPLRVWRDRQGPDGITVEEAAARMKISAGYINQIETRMRPPGRKVAEIISNATGISMDTLMRVELRDPKSRRRRARKEAANKGRAA